MHRLKENILDFDEKLDNDEYLELFFQLCFSPNLCRCVRKDRPSCKLLIKERQYAR